MLKKEIILLILFLGCKSIDNTEYKSQKDFKPISLREIVTKIDCPDNDSLMLSTDNQTYIKVDSELCGIFSEYLSKNMMVHVNIIGVVKDSVLYKNDGNYRVLEYDSLKKSLKQLKQVRLPFGNHGFIDKPKEYKKTIFYKVSNINFQVINSSNNIKKGENDKVKLTFILYGN